MTGLLLLGVVGLWILFVVVFTRWATKRIESRAIKSLCAAMLFSVLLIAPVGDELVGRYQFEALCKQYAAQHIDGERAMNRRVEYVSRGRDVYAERTAVKIQVDPYVYLDVETKEIAVRFHLLTAEGGWLIHTLGISETNSPLTFNPVCVPPNAFAFKKTFNITVIN